MQRWSAATIATSVVLHGLVALALTRIVSVVPTPPPKPQTPTVVWFGGWEPLPEAAEQEGDDDADSESSHAEPDAATVPSPNPMEIAPTPEPVIAQESPAPEPPQPAAIAQPPEPPGPAIDWAEARRRSIEDVVKERERAASYRSFSFPGTLGEKQALEESERERRATAGLQPPKTAFDSPSKGRAGLAEQNAFGEYIVWVTDECYQTFGTKNIFILPSAQELFGAPMTTCVAVQPRGDLFENAKPSYLVGVEEREDRTDRLRRLDAGGAIASFGD